MHNPFGIITQIITQILKHNSNSSWFPTFVCQGKSYSFIKTKQNECYLGGSFIFL